jgi:hypothetical protein
MTGRDFFERYGVTLVVLAALALIVALLPGNATTQSASQLTGTAGTGFAAGAELPADSLGGSLDSGTVAGGRSRGASGYSGPAGSGLRTIGGPAAGGIEFGKGYCRADKRQAGVVLYMPPCLTYSGSNGGETARGVSKDKIKVVRYLGQLDPGTRAILESANLSDPEEVRGADYEALRRYANQHYFTYGREVTFQIVNASGPAENDEAMKADAIKIANDIKAFAVIDGSPDAPIPKVLAQELAQRGVLCICLTSLSQQFYRETPPYIFSSLPTSDEYAQHIGEYIGKRLARRNAQWAGDEFAPAQRYRQAKRVFGLIYLTGTRGKVDPEGKRARDTIVKELARYGVKFKVEIAYLYEGGRNAQDVTSMIAKMKSEGVTTVVPWVDPLYPILITQEATRQGYFPEWFVSGSGLSDTTAAGRLYDQQQWRHAFGISPLWITWKTLAKSYGFRMRQHGTKTDPDNVGILINIYASYFNLFWAGVQLAGPSLTPDNFAKGLYTFPKTGGTPGAPLFFLTREAPTVIKDFTEVWYDYNRPGPDEREEQGNGMMMKVNGGKRYLQGQWPASNPKAFVEDGTEVAVSDTPTGSVQLPHEEDGHRHEGACLSCSG